VKIRFEVKETGKPLKGYLVASGKVFKVDGVVDVPEDVLKNGFLFKGIYNGVEFEYRFDEPYSYVKLSEKELLYEATSLDLKLVEQLIFSKINDFREKSGLRKLRWSEKVANVSREKSKLISKKFEHDVDGKSAFKMLRERGVYFLTVGENIYRISGLTSAADEDFVAERCVDSWKKSERHRRVMLEDFNVGGVGCFAKGKSIYVTFIAILNEFTISSSFKKGQKMFLQAVDEEYRGKVRIKVTAKPEKCFKIECPETCGKDDVILVEVLEDCDGKINVEYLV